MFRFVKGVITMKRFSCAVMSAVLLITCLLCGALPIQADASSFSRISSPDRPWLPDPCNVFQIDGSYLQTETAYGVTYDYYIYEPTMTMDQLSKATHSYITAIDDMGYQCQAFDMDGFICCYAFSYPGCPNAEMAVTIQDLDVYPDDPDAPVPLIVLLAVPRELDFRLDEETPDIIGGTRACITCHGSTCCKYCHGSGRYYYGGKSDDCSPCRGTGTCSVCDGSGLLFD